MSHAAIYVRQSEDKTGHAAAVSRQEQDCRKLAEAKGWSEPKLFADNSISATSGKERPQFEQLLRDIESGMLTQVAVWHLDRLTRSMRDLTRIIEAGRRHRVNIACVHGVSLDLGDPTGVAVAQILTAIAGMEVAHKGERQRAANKQRAEGGKAFWTRRPFGYDRDKAGKVFVVDAEAEAIRAAARDVLSGATLASVARSWTAAGLLTTYSKKDPQTKLQAEGGKPWGVTQVKRVLLNPRYCGRRVYNGDDMGEGEWEPILTEDEHRELERYLSDPRRKSAPEDLNVKYLLSGIARCGKCGNPMYASPTHLKGKSWMVYRCFGGYCLARRLDLVDDVVESVMLGRLARPDIASRLAQPDDVAELRQKAAKIRENRAALARLLADGLLTEADVRAEAGKLKLELDGIEAQMARATALNPLSAFIGADDVKAIWGATTLEDRRKIIRWLMDVSIMPAGKGVRFSEDQVRIDWK